MRKVLSISVLFLLLALKSYCQGDTLNVLFLGNSYTAANNLPQITENLAAAANKTLITDWNTPGGHTLENHSTNSTSMNKIKQGNWDFVILQEQSQIPTIDYYRYNSMYPGAENLNDSISKYNPCAQVAMFMTWGRRFGGQQCDPGGNYCSPVFSDFSHMQDSLESAYVEKAEDIDAYISPVGIAWKNVIEDTAVVLHTNDDSHPNNRGSYLAACVFHSILWDESPIGLNFNGSLSNSLAGYFQAIADSTVFHSYSDWNRNVDNVNANFSYSTHVDSVQFTNLSQSLSPASYFWEFGDGSTSTAENPSHTYSSNQTYTVSLIVEHCSKSDTITQTINLNSVDIESEDFRSSINVFPNPFVSNIEISINKNNTPGLYAKIMNPSGKLVASFDFNNEQNLKLDLDFLSSGFYFLQLSSKKSGERATFKLIKK